MLCANSILDIKCAKSDGCPFFNYLFGLPLLESDVSPESGGILLNVKCIRTMIERELEDTWNKHYVVFYKSKRLCDKDPVPMSRLCSDPQRGK